MKGPLVKVAGLFVKAVFKAVLHSCYQRKNSFPRYGQKFQLFPKAGKDHHGKILSNKIPKKITKLGFPIKSAILQVKARPQKNSWKFFKALRKKKIEIPQLAGQTGPINHFQKP